MTRVQRISRTDGGFLPDTIQRTPQGGARIPAVVTRTGVLRYWREDGTQVREYRPSTEVLVPESFETMNGATVTLEHPGTVTPETFQAMSRGHVAEGSVKPEGSLLTAVLVVQDRALLDDIAQGIRTEVSAGYTCEINPTPGVSPEGEEYDAIQQKVRYNHVAVVAMGRAGRDVCLRLDSAGNAVETELKEREQVKRTIRIDGVEFPLGTPEEIDAAVNAYNRSVAAGAAIVARADSAEKTVAELRAALAASEKTAVDLRVQVLSATRFDAEDMDVLAKARAILGADYNPEGKTAGDVMRDVVVKAMPTKDLANASEDYIRGLFDALETPADETAEDGATEGEKPAEGEKPTEEKTDSATRKTAAIATGATRGNPTGNNATPQVSPREAMIARKIAASHKRG